MCECFSTRLLIGIASLLSAFAEKLQQAKPVSDPVQHR